MQFETIGDYIVQQPLGEGAFGSVYLAQHRFIKRTFALKVLPAEVSADPQFLRRLEAEIAFIAALDHPNIAKIHAVSLHEEMAYLVTDPIVDSLGATMNLERFFALRGLSLDEKEQEQWLRQIGSALDYAHEAGVAHGGVKPSNILIAQDEQGLKPILSDFGIARLIGEHVAFSKLSERIANSLAPKAKEFAKNFVRSFAFLSPEQKELGGEQTPLKNDMYAFGVLVYYLLSGKLPDGAFEMPSRLLPNYRLNWDLLIQRCLQHNPNMRPQTIALAMDECLYAKEMTHLSEVESVLQMAFEFPALVESTAAALSDVATEPLRPVIRPAQIARPEYEPDPAAIFQRDLLVSHYEPKKVEIREVEPMLTEMVVVGAGAYFRGSPEGARDEMPRHSVTLSAFALDIHPVTNEQFVRFLQAMGGEKDQNNNDIIRLRDARIKRSGGKLIIESGYGKHPVAGVTWYGSVAYASWIGKRLPTEAEWEAAAAGRNENFFYPTGRDIERTQANFFSSDTTPVMSYPPNPFGLYDMAGNVYEWCHDWYAYNYYDASALEPQSPMGPPQGVYRVLRGGCWKSLKDDLRCSHRHRNNPGAVNGTYGFRCAADVST